MPALPPSIISATRAATSAVHHFTAAFHHASRPEPPRTISIRPLPRLAWAAVRPTSSDSITRIAALENRSAPAALFVLAMIVSSAS